METAREIVTEIIEVPLEDYVRFEIREVSVIMDEAEYGGVRISLDTFLDTMRIPWKIDISTGDAITPSEISYQYKLMFEQRTICLWAYSLENVLAEKIETILVRATFNTRLRDFYDIHILQNIGRQVDTTILFTALTATCHRRNSEYVLPDYNHILTRIEKNQTMCELWQNFRKKNSYAAGITWETVMQSVCSICKACLG